MNRLRIPFLIIIGLIIGLGLGLYIGWEAYPTEFVNASPAYLSDTHRREYVRMIAGAYAVEGDLAVAQTRLASLGEGGQELLTAVTLDAILQPQSETEIRQLVTLATALGIYSPAMEPYLAPATEPVP
jgi:uncharacterized membrane protein